MKLKIIRTVKNPPDPHFKREMMTHSSSSATLIIKNMVCDRCIRVVRDELSAAGLILREVTLGSAVVEIPPAGLPREKIASVLRAAGFDLIDDKRRAIVEKIKNVIVQTVHHDWEKKDKISAIIIRDLGIDYSAASSLFSEIQQMTIEHFFILQRIERVKELLKYDEQTLSEIADQLGYSSVAHLSNQFKKVTGMSASRYKSMRDAKRTPIDKV